MARKKKNAALELPAIVIEATTNYLGVTVMNKLDAKRSAILFELAGIYAKNVALTIEVGATPLPVKAVV